MPWTYQLISKIPSYPVWTQPFLTTIQGSVPRYSIVTGDRPHFNFTFYFVVGVGLRI
jgi:hypothetical protein